MRILDAVVAADQRHDLATVEGLVPWRRLAGEVLRDHPVGIALEEEAGRNVEHLRHIVEAACRNPNIPGFVFLHRLEGNADLAGESALAQAELNAPQPHSAADIDVDRMRLIVLA